MSQFNATKSKRPVASTSFYDPLEIVLPIFLNREGVPLRELEYDQIESAPQSIRILKLWPSDRANSIIECELVQTSLNSPGHLKYEALSWCWGTSPETAWIRVRRGRKTYAKKMKPDLVNALLTLRRPEKDRYLWIDTMCINQEDMDEKSQQVAMMAEIYGKARRVCIWLGLPDDSSRVAINFIREEVLRQQDFDDLCDNEIHAPKWKALFDLMQRPWFSRRWVVQEIALARQALIYCGEDKISWNKFSVGVELFVEIEMTSRRLSETMKKDRKYHQISGHGWFEYISQLPANLLVETTGRLFRGHKQFRESITSNARDSDSEAMSDDTDREDKDDEDEDEDEEEVEAEEDERPGGYLAFERPKLFPASELALPVKNQLLLPLESLVSGLAILNVTNAHDAIYALLAIAKDAAPPVTNIQDWQLPQLAKQVRYEIDYKKPYVDVCQYFIKFCIHRALGIDASRALDIILRPWAIPEAKIYSRFKEDMQAQEIKKNEEKKRNAKKKNGRSKSNAPLIGGEKLRRVDYVPLPSWVPQLTQTPFAMQMAPGFSGEKVGRINADPLVGLPFQGLRKYQAAEDKQVDLRTLKFRKQTGLGTKDNYSSIFVKGFVLDTIVEVKDTSQSGNIPSEWADFVGWEGAQGSPPDAFWRTLMGGRGRDGKSPPAYYAKVCEETFQRGGYLSGSISTSDIIRNERTSVISHFCWIVQSVIWRKALARTESGKLALVAAGVKEGDLVCILYGCSVPVILRMSEEKNEYQIIEEAKLELITVANHLQGYIKTWLAKIKHYRKKRGKEKAKYEVWAMSKKLLFLKDSKWRTEWKRKREQIESEASPGSKKEIAKRERFEPRLAKGQKNSETVLNQDDRIGEHGMPVVRGGQQNGYESTRMQHLGHQRVLSEWDYIAEKLRERKLTFDDIKKRGFASRYEQYLQACEFDDWKKEKREKARKFRHEAIIDPSALNESSWAEPAVNWREFELRLRYRRRWKKILRNRREEEEDEIMKLRDKKREARGFKLRERPIKKKVRLLETEEVEKEGENKKRTQLTKEAASEVEGIWLENVMSAMRNEERDEPSDEGTEQPQSIFPRTPSWRSDQGWEFSMTEVNVEKSRQSYRFSYKLLGDCYLHGMMDGEAIAVQNDRSIPSVIFEIR